MLCIAAGDGDLQNSYFVYFRSYISRHADATKKFHVSCFCHAFGSKVYAHRNAIKESNLKTKLYIGKSCSC